MSYRVEIVHRVKADKYSVWVVRGDAWRIYWNVGAATLARLEPFVNARYSGFYEGV